MDTNYSLSDIAAASGGMNGFGGGEGIWFLLLVVLLGGGGFGWNRNAGDFGQYATAASQQEILFNQHFNNLDNKMDRGFTSIGNGIADATFALNNTIVNGNNMIAGRVVDEGRGIQAQMAQGFSDTNATTIAQTQKILDAMAQNKIDSLQAQVTELKTQNMFCGIPRINPYGYGVYPYQGCGCNCGGYAN